MRTFFVYYNDMPLPYRLQETAMGDLRTLDVQSIAGETLCDDDDYFSNPEPGVCLYFYGGSNDHKCVALTQYGDYLLGRSRDSAFRFSDYNRIDARVSRKHAVLRVDRGSVTLVNQTPRNGIMLNGVSLDDNQEEPLNDTDVITLGDKGPNIRVRIGDLNMLEQEPPRHGD